MFLLIYRVQQQREFLMKEAKETKSQFSRIYKRTSKSPFRDSNTLLFLADVIEQNKGAIKLGFENYIYLHRAESGENLGISVSRQLLDKSNLNDIHYAKYMSGSLMYRFLLEHLNDITQFCNIFEDEFVGMFMLPPDEFFCLAKNVWQKYLQENQAQ